MLYDFFKNPYLHSVGKVFKPIVENWNEPIGKRCHRKRILALCRRYVIPVGVRKKEIDNLGLQCQEVVENFKWVGVQIDNRQTACKNPLALTAVQVSKNLYNSR